MRNDVTQRSAARPKPDLGALVSAIENFSLLYAGTPDSRAERHLEGFLTSIEPGITEALGASNATVILDGLR
jgi:hypothetical protein